MRALAAPVRRALFRTTIVPGWIAVAAVAGWYTAGFAVPRSLRLGVLVVGVALLGLPHGGIDHLALPRVRQASPSPRWLGLVGLLYLVLGGLYAVVWFVSPVLAVLGFVGLTWVHWGQGDLWPLLAVTGAEHLQRGSRRIAAMVLRGALPMLLPLWSHPQRYRAVVEAIVRQFGLEQSLAGIGHPTTRLAILLGLGSLSILVLGSGLRASGLRRGWVIDAGETALLWWVFLAVPPVFAIGVYFVAWHSLRHVGRLLAVDPAASQALAAGRWTSAASRFVGDATPLTLLSLLGLLGLSLAVPRPPTSVDGGIALALVFIAVLTLPHVVVVTDMDLCEGIWTWRRAA